MNKTALLIAMTLTPVGAQIQQRPVPPSTVTAKPPAGVSLPAAGTTGGIVLDSLEKDLDRRISTTGGTDPCYLLGLTRGLYISGFGAVFTAELDLVANSPQLGPFKTSVTPEEKATVHKRKLAHVPLLQNTLRDMIAALAASPALKNAPDTDQLVVAARLVYRPWEDTSGLPSQIVVRSDRRGGNIRTEVQ